METAVSNIIEKCGFVRETDEDLFALMKSEDLDVADVIYKIIPSTNPRTELFTLSVYLYGFSPDKRRCKYDFFFYCQNLYELPIKFKRNEEEETFTFSYKYDPVFEGDYINPCHFIFCVRDSLGLELPRQADKPSIQKRNKALVNHILEEYLCKAVCFDPNLLQKWDIKNNQELERFRTL